MGKRSSFERIPKDFYRTFDARALPPLIPHLRPGGCFSEPCAGEADLIRQMVGAGFTLQDAMDLEPKDDRIRQGDALVDDLGHPEMFVTNPPWSRPILHALIVRLSDIAPTFLLFDSNWANTKQAGPFMDRCRKIIQVGRLIWIPGTKMTGKDDVAWYEFGRPVEGANPLFFGRDRLPSAASKRARRLCADCGVVIDRFDRWRLVERNGQATPAHWCCERPNIGPGQPTEPAPMPLLEWGGCAD